MTTAFERQDLSSAPEAAFGDLLDGFPRTRTLRFAPDQTRPLSLGAQLSSDRRIPRASVTPPRSADVPIGSTEAPRTPTWLAPVTPSSTRRRFSVPTTATACSALPSICWPTTWPVTAHAR